MSIKKIDLPARIFYVDIPDLEGLLVGPVPGHLVVHHLLPLIPLYYRGRGALNWTQQLHLDTQLQ